MYTAIDPIAPATTSVTLVRDVIRDWLEFRGLLMSDDISMGALSGSIEARSRAAIAAGCDLVLHCNGKLDEMQAVASAVPTLAGEAAAQTPRPPSLGAGSLRQHEPGGTAGRMDGAHGGPRRRPEGDIMNPDEIKFEADLTTERATDEPALVVDVEGFEGPLDLLLALARQQKVDLAKISILALADQYLTFIEEARKLRLELAADYLVMAAWLAYLKSRLLLPDANAPEGQSAEDMAIALALRLKRLEAIRDGRRAPVRPRAARSRRVPARPARADRPHQASAMDGDALRPALGLRAAAAEDALSGMCGWPNARSGRWPRRAKRSSG